MCEYLGRTGYLFLFFFSFSVMGKYLAESLLNTMMCNDVTNHVFYPLVFISLQRTGLGCGYHLAMAAVKLYGILPPIRPTNQIVSGIFRFPKLVLIRPFRLVNISHQGISWL